MFSTNNGESIKKENGIKAIRAYDLNPSLKEFNDALKLVNFRDLENISLQEFEELAAILTFEEDEPEEVLNACFKRLDKDGSGIISLQEFRDLMMNRGEPLSQAEFDDLIKLTDSDHNGQVTYKEFVKLFTQVFD